jgi:hypothetical protein
LSLWGRNIESAMKLIKADHPACILNPLFLMEEGIFFYDEE